MESRSDRPKALSTSAIEKEQILALSPFGSLDPEGQRALLELGKVETIPKLGSLAEQGSPARSLYLLGSGRVKLERSSAGHVLPLGHRGPGDLVGEGGVAGGSSTESATVVDDVDALVLPIGSVKRLFAQDARVRVAILAAQVERNAAAQERLTSLLRLGVEARLAEFLLRAGRRWGHAHPSGELVSVSFTHAELATLIGSTRETVTLLLGRMKREGLIAFDKRRVVI
jgi:CRP-like cAMP-binding protein